MNDQLSSLRERLSGAVRQRLGRPSADRSEGARADSLQLFAAELLLVTGIGATVEALRNRGRAADREEGGNGLAEAGLATSWAPAVLGPLAAIAHAAYAFSPTDRHRTATRVLDVAAVGGALVALSGVLAATRGRALTPSLTSLSLASAGALGLLLDRTAAEQEAERRKLERRAALVEHLVPRRRARLDRIVVHV